MIHIDTACGFSIFTICVADVAVLYQLSWWLDAVAEDIGTLEALGKYFRCTGSSMEVLAEEWSKREDGGFRGESWRSDGVFFGSLGHRPSVPPRSPSRCISP